MPKISVRLVGQVCMCVRVGCHNGSPREPCRAVCVGVRSVVAGEELYLVGDSEE